MRFHSLTQSVSLYHSVFLHLCSKLHRGPAGAHISPETIIPTSQKIALVIICIILKFDQLLHGLQLHVNKVCGIITLIQILGNIFP